MNINEYKKHVKSAETYETPAGNILTIEWIDDDMSAMISLQDCSGAIGYAEWFFLNIIDNIPTLEIDGRSFPAVDKNTLFRESIKQFIYNDGTAHEIKLWVGPYNGDVRYNILPSYKATELQAIMQMLRCKLIDNPLNNKATENYE